MPQPCAPCRLLVWRRAWQEAPHAALTAVRDGPAANWRSGGGRRTQYSCTVCQASLVRSAVTRLEPGWRLGQLSGNAGPAADGSFVCSEATAVPVELLADDA